MVTCYVIDGTFLLLSILSLHQIRCLKFPNQLKIYLLPKQSVIMSQTQYQKFRYLVYSAKVLVPTKTPIDNSNASASKKRKSESSELSLTAKSQQKGLAYWLDAYTDFDYAVINHDPSLHTHLESVRCCDDITWEHQHIMIFSETPKQMEKTLKSFVRYEGKVLHEIRARLFIPLEPFETFKEQFLHVSARDVAQRGDEFEKFLRAEELGLLNTSNRTPKMEVIWGIEKSSPIRRLELSTISDYHRRLLAKIESLESTDSPFKQSVEAFIDILACGFGSFHYTDHSTYLEVRCGLSAAQCSCWECWESSLESSEDVHEQAAAAGSDDVI